MKRLAALALTVLTVAILALAGGGTHTAHAQSPTASETSSRLQLDVDQLTPRQVTSASTTVNVSGKVTNVGDRTLTELKVRLELGERQASDRQLRATLAEAPPTGASQSRYFDVAATLTPGQTANFVVSVPLGSAAGGLQVSRAGVYPLLINVNGTPEYGDQARLAALSTLLPVVSAPGKPATESEASGPTDMSLLWPITDVTPRLVAAPYGGTAVLADDQLAVDLAPGGRLDALVTSARAKRSDPKVFGALCFAVDVDLLETATAMAQGYTVRGPSGDVPGQGVEQAKRWLNSLRQLVAGQCVIQVPYANGDIAALARVPGGGDLIATATRGEARIQELLGVQPLSGVLWPDTALDNRAVQALTTAGVNTIITDQSRLQAGTKATTGTKIAGSSLRAQPADSLLASAFAPKAASAGGTTVSSNNEPDLATQNGLSVLAYYGSSAQTPARPLLVAPPHRWTAPASELDVLLRTVSEYAGKGLVSPTPLQDLLDAPATGNTAVNYTAQDASASAPSNTTDELSKIHRSITDVRGAMSVDPTTLVEPDQLIAPLRMAILRACSSAWRGNASTQAVGTAQAQLAELLGRVTVETPRQRITLASGESPLPVYISSRLPVSITVQINLYNNTGLRPDPIPNQTIAANSGVQRPLPAEALRAGRFSMEVSLSTPAGTKLGNSATFDLTSNEYGMATIIVTVSAAGALLLLSGRRLYQRFRNRGSRTAGSDENADR